MGELLGNGSFGKVYKCTHRSSGQVVAVKVPIYHTSVDKEERRFLKKILWRGNPDEVNIIRLLGTIKVKGIPSLVLEYLPLSLSVFLQQVGPMRISQVRCLGNQLLKAINFLMDCDIVHGDIKPDNIMVAGCEEDVVRIKLIDLGGIEVTEVNPPRVWRQLSTLCYRSPEVVMGLPASFPIDTWAVSVVLVEAFMGRTAFPAQSNQNLVDYFCNVFGDVHSDLLKGKNVHLYYKKTAPSFFCKKEWPSPIFPCPLGFMFDGVKAMSNGKSEADRRDTASFVDFLKKGLCLSPKERIAPEKAFGIKFFGLDHSSSSSQISHPCDNSEHGNEPCAIKPNTTNQPSSGNEARRRKLKYFR